MKQESKSEYISARLLVATTKQVQIMWDVLSTVVAFLNLLSRLYWSLTKRSFLDRFLLFCWQYSFTDYFYSFGRSAEPCEVDVLFYGRRR